MDQLNPDQRAVGRDNYFEAVGFTRRDFIRGVVGAGAVTGAGLGALTFGYGKLNDPVRIGIVGTGDEGSVLIGGCNPEYVTVKAICDIRPYNVWRAFHGDWSSPAAMAARPGLIKQYKFANEAEARAAIKVYDSTNGGIQAMLNDDELEAIIIALPLHLHAPVAIQAMQKGKHVLTEKLMAHNVAQCKVMARAAQELKDSKGNPLLLATGHQRHYSVLYDNAIHLIQQGLLGQVHSIRAQWHRGNTPSSDSWKMPVPGGETVRIDGQPKKVDEIANRLASLTRALKSETDPEQAQLISKQLEQWTAWNADAALDAEKHGYITMTLGDRVRTAMEELCRWRLFDRTGGGLMAELGSHQLDASTLFISGLHNIGKSESEKKKVRPLSVHAVGGRYIFPQDREVDDHVYCMYEFPSPTYPKGFDVGYYSRTEDFPPGGPTAGLAGYDSDPQRRIVVTYSTINGNGFGGYGEVVMGTKGTLILEQEKEVMLYKDSDTASRVGVKKAGGGFALDTQASGSYSAPAAKAAEQSGPVSRGYTEEIEHWAWCIRNPAPENKPRCYPEVAMADAVIALTTNVALRKAANGDGGYLQFQDAWFERDNDATPDGSDIGTETESLKQPVA
jgi:predicted dehydrogenase